MADDDIDDETENSEVAEGEDGEEGEEGAKKGGLKKILMIVVPLLLLGGGGGGAYFMGYLDGLLGIEKAIECEEGDHECEEAAAAAAEHGDEDDGHGKKDKKDSHGKKDDGHGGEGGGDETAFLAIPPMTVNLNTEDGTPRFLRLTVQLELEDPSEKGEVEAVIPRVIDQFQTYLRELRVRDLRGSSGVYRLQMELLWRVNQAVEPIEIKDVLFQEILIQ